MDPRPDDPLEAELVLPDEAGAEREAEQARARLGDAARILERTGRAAMAYLSAWSSPFDPPGSSK